MARKPTLSPSRITTYLACPAKYRWTFQDPRGKWYLRSKSCYSFGTTLHKVLERFHDSGDCGVSTTYQALAAYEESWLDAGFSSAEEMAEVEQHLTLPVSGKTLFVERLFKKDMGDFTLVGRVDRVDELEDGTLEIIDYKSGRESVCVDDVRSDIAMACYQLLLRSQFPDRAVCASILALRTNQKATCALSDEELDEFAFDLRELGRRILCHDWYELVPVSKQLCIACDFVTLCRKHPEFDLPEEVSPSVQLPLG
jgi:putative RecB family exonuclease